MNHIMKYVIGAVLGIMLGGGIEFERGNHEILAALTIGYGCGRHDAERTAQSDPAEYDWPPCLEAYRVWRESEDIPR